MRPRVVLPLLLGLVILLLGPRPAVVSLAPGHRTAQAADTPKPNWLPDLLGHPAGLVARPVHPSGLVDRGRASGRAALDRGLALRAQVRGAVAAGGAYSTGR
jgi:hypothetical protein